MWVVLHPGVLDDEGPKYCCSSAAAAAARLGHAEAHMDDILTKVQQGQGRVKLSGFGKACGPEHECKPGYCGQAAHLQFA